MRRVFLLLLLVVQLSAAKTNDTDPGKPNYVPDPQELNFIAGNWRGEFASRTNYGIFIYEQGLSAMTRWKIRHDWLEREIGRKNLIIWHKDQILDIKTRQISSMKLEVIGSKIIIGLVVVAAVFGGTYAIVKKL